MAADWLGSDRLQLGSADPGAIFAALDDLLELVRPPAWMLDALCREPQYRGLPWFPERGESTSETKSVCARCLVTDECARFALEHLHTGIDGGGIWGGTSRRQRKTLKASLRRAA